MRPQAFLGLFFLLWPVSAAFSQTNHSLLWEISSPNLKHPSYIFGTIHVICADDFTPSDSLLQAIHTSKVLWLELDPTDLSLPHNLREMMVMKNGQNLSELISVNDYQKIKHFLEDTLEIKEEWVQNFKPIVLTNLLYSRFLSCDKAESVENLLLGYARASETEIKGMETLDEQIELLDQIPYTEQASMLLEMIDEYARSIEEFNTLQKLYKNQNVEQLSAIIDETQLGYTAFNQKLLKERNIRWLPILEKSLQSSPGFIAVGAAHLGGNDGLLELFRQNGYTLKPISAFR